LNKRKEKSEVESKIEYEKRKKECEKWMMNKKRDVSSRSHQSPSHLG